MRYILEYDVKPHEYSRIIYGDTDSCMIELKTKSFSKFTGLIEKNKNKLELNKEDQEELNKLRTTMIEESFHEGKELANEITGLFNKPIKLEFEKVYSPFISLSKKRYIGNYYGKSPYKIDFVENKGVVLKRRDNPDIVKRIYKGIITPLLDHGSKGINMSVDFLKKELYKLINGKVDLNELIITKALTKGYGKLCTCDGNIKCSKRVEAYSKSFVEDECLNGVIKQSGDYANFNLPQVALAIKIRNRDIGSAPVSGDRINYVFTFDKNNPKAKLYEQVENLDYANEHNLIINYLYYIENQLKNPIREVLNLVIPNADEIFDEIIKEYKDEVTEYIKIAKSKKVAALPKGQRTILKWVKK